MRCRLIFMLVMGFMVIGVPLLQGDSWQEWHKMLFNSPFQEANRTAYRTIHRRTISVFGAPRMTYLKGHKHAGIDLRGNPEEKVYAIAKGTVAAIQLSFPDLTVVVKHELNGLSPIYSRYTHVEEIRVQIGDQVDQNTQLARLFNAEELKISRFGVTHLHLEIRKRIDDECTASWTSLTLSALNEYCTNPLTFFQTVLTISGDRS